MPKVLRIGIVHQGSIVEEEIVRRRETVTIGESPKATFFLPYTALPLPKKFPLFLLRGDAYHLVFTDKMTGTLRLDGKSADLQELKAQAKRHDGAYELPLTDKHRGRLKINDLSILFGFVDAPPKPARPKLPPSFRAGFIKSLDWTFMSIFMTLLLAEVIVLAYASTFPMPEKKSLSDIDERFRKILMPESVNKEVMDQLRKQMGKQVATATGQEEKGEEKPAEKAETAKGKGKGGGQQVSAEEAAAAAARRKAEIAKKVAGTGLVALLTSKGTSNSAMGAINDTLSNGARYGSIDDAMQGISGVGIATSGTQRGRRGGGTGDGPASKDLSQMAISQGGSAEVSGRTEEAVKGRTKQGTAEVYGGTLDEKCLKSRINMYVGAIQACYEQELRRNPKLAGRIVVAFTVSPTGKVSRSEIAKSDMGNPVVEECIAKKFMSILFCKPEGGEVDIEYPFIFEPVR